MKVSTFLTQKVDPDRYPVRGKRVKGKRANQLSYLVTIFSLQTINYGGSLWLRAKTKANFKPKLKMKVI